MSSNVAVSTGRFREAADFISKVLGFPDRSADPELAELDASPLTWYIVEDEEIPGW